MLMQIDNTLGFPQRILRLAEGIPRMDSLGIEQGQMLVRVQRLGKSKSLEDAVSRRRSTLVGQMELLLCRDT